MKFLSLEKNNGRFPAFINIGSFILSLVVNSGMGALFWIIGARYYDPIIIGIISVVISIINLFTLLSKFGFDYGVTRFLPNKSNSDSKKLINSITIISGTTASILALLLLFVSILLFNFEPFFSLRFDFFFLVSFILFSGFSVINDLQEFILASAGTSIYTLIKNLLTNSIKILLLILSLFLFSNNDYFGIYFAVMISITLAFLINTFYFIPKSFTGYSLSFQYENADIKTILPFSLSNQLEGIINAIPLYIFPIFIANFIGLEQSAFFYIGFYLAYFIFDISGIISKIMVSEITVNRFGNNITKNSKLMYQKAVLFNIVIVGPIIIIMLLFPEFVLNIFGTEYATESKLLLEILSFSGIVVVINNLLLIYHRLNKRVKSISIINISILVLLILLSIILFNTYEIIGFGYAWLISQFLGMCINFVLVLFQKFK